MNAAQQTHLDSCRLTGCPVCRLLARSGLTRTPAGELQSTRRPERSRAVLAPAPVMSKAEVLARSPVKPRMSLAEVANRNRRCREQRALGLPCTAWAAPELPEHYQGMLAPPEASESLRWAYAVTTVPERRDTYLPGTLASLERAGFPYPRLLVDGDTPGPRWRSLGLPATFREQRIGAYGNWFLGLWEVYVRNPDCDRYALFQDDLVASRNLRAFLDRCLYPDPPLDEPGYWNLYTFPENQSLCPLDGAYRGWFLSNQRGKGAVGLVFSRRAVQTLLTGNVASEHFLGRFWNPDNPKRQSENLDGGVVTAATKGGLWEYVHNPSLVQHAGDVSALRHGPFPKAETFRGESFDLLDLLPGRA